MVHPKGRAIARPLTPIPNLGSHSILMQVLSLPFSLLPSLLPSLYKLTIYSETHIYQPQIKILS